MMNVTSLAFSTVPIIFITSVACADRLGTNKTLVAWVIPADLTQRGGSALTIQSGDRFDAIVLGEKVPGRWMAGSDNLRRTQTNQGAYPAETADDKTTVQIGIVYDGGEIRIYRNGQPYAAYRAKNIDLLGIDNHVAVFGLRHVGAGSGTPLAGAIEDARIYARALTQAQIAALKPNVKSKIAPLAWWDFQGDKVIDRAGRFTHSAMTGGVKLAGGRLVLDGKGYLVAARSEADVKMAMRGGNPRAPGRPYVPQTPAWPKKPPANWLTFHLAHPGPGVAIPGDPNCAFDYKGRYHLHYIYRDHTGFVFAHVSSDDMVRWKWHPTVLAPPVTGHGMFSGTGFYTKDGRPAIIYAGQGSGKDWIAYALDDQMDKWSEPEAVIGKTKDGKNAPVRYADPDCWLIGDTYYALTGYKNPHLLKSSDLKNWRDLGLLLHDDYPAKKLGIAKDEDISCANMFKIGNKWMLLCISHPLGCRYYLGDFKGKGKDNKYLPDFHAMMNWQKAGRYGFYFAPESVLTRDGRRVMWAWIKERVSPTGVQSLPRELELPADGILRIKPLREFDTLRYGEKTAKQITIKSDTDHKLRMITGDAVELEITVAAPLPKEFGINLLGDKTGKEGMSITTGAARKTLKIGTIRPPFALEKGENLTLRVFIDKNLVEVFANDRQAAAFAHKHIRKDPNISLFAKGGDVVVKEVKAWKMKTIYEGDSVFRGERRK